MGEAEIVVEIVRHMRTISGFATRKVCQECIARLVLPVVSVRVTSGYPESKLIQHYTNRVVIPWHCHGHYWSTRNKTCRRIANHDFAGLAPEKPDRCLQVDRKVVTGNSRRLFVSGKRDDFCIGQWFRPTFTANYQKKATSEILIYIEFNILVNNS